MAPAGYGDRVEGLHAVAAAAAAGRVEELWVEKHRLGRPEYRAIVDRIREGRILVHEVDDVLPLADSESPQGLLASCRPLIPRTLEELVPTDRPAAVMMLDHVVDPHNVGAVARSVAGAGLDGIVVSTRRAAPLSAVAFKAAAGALEVTPVAIVNSIADAVARLQKLGLWCVGLDSKGEQSLFGLPLLTEPVAFVLGEEGGGISRLVADRVEVRARIPLAEGIESLNVSVAAGLAAFEVMRMRRK